MSWLQFQQYKQKHMSTPNYICCSHLGFHLKLLKHFCLNNLINFLCKMDVIIDLTCDPSEGNMSLAYLVMV